MSRIARVIVPGMPHHFTQRGNRSQKTFFSDDDRQFYLISLAKFSARYGLSVWAYCLMDNHVHIIGVPQSASAPGDVFRALHTQHSRKVNAREGLAGHLWQGRYFSTVLDEGHLAAAVRYVERNPVRAGIVARPEDFEWSSARAHCGLTPDPVLTPDMPLLSVVSDWQAWLGSPEDALALARLRLSTMKGDPCGADGFAEEIGQVLGRNLTRGQRGRPRKKRDRH